VGRPAEPVEPPGQGGRVTRHGDVRHRGMGARGRRDPRIASLW